jgi:hypothetical protein
MYACLYRPPDHDHRSARGDCSENVLKTSACAASAAVPRDSLVAIAQEFSPRYESHESRGGVVSAVTIDVRGLDRLLGPPRTIGEELRREAAERGVRAHVAVAGTCTAALVLALARPGLTVVDPGAPAASANIASGRAPVSGGGAPRTFENVAEALAPLPIEILEKLSHDQPQRTPRSQWHNDPDHSACSAIAAVKRWGIRTLGEFTALPSGDLSARLGRQGLVWQALARGEDIRPLVPDVADERFESAMALDWPIEGLEPLSFVLTRLLEPLSVRLERRDRGVAVLHVQLGLVTKETHARRLQLPSPLRDVRTLRTLALVDLESHPPPAAVDRVTVVVDPTPGRVLQHTLFARPHPTPEQLSTLLARLAAVMGQDRIGAPATADSYRPGVFEMKPFATEHDITKNRSHGHRRARSDRSENLLQISAGAASAAVNRGDAPATSLEPPSALNVVPPLTSSPQPLASALRRCRQPVPARVAADAAGRPVRVTTDRRGFAGGLVMTASGPWSTSGEWWAGLTRESEEAGGAREGGRARGAGVAGQAGWDRDEWDVTLTDGGTYRIFLDHGTRGWFIDAIYD